jgi:hypothetical protein
MMRPSYYRFAFSLIWCATLGALIGFLPNPLCELDIGHIVTTYAFWCGLGAAIGLLGNLIDSRQQRWRAACGNAILVPLFVVIIHCYACLVLTPWEPGVTAGVVGALITISLSVLLQVSARLVLIRPSRADYKQSVQTILSSHNLSVCEYQALAMVFERVPLTQVGLARYAKERGDQGRSLLGTFTFDEYSKAVEACIAKGLLVLLSEKALANIAASREASTIPEIDESFFAAGTVDFTASGYALCHDVTGAINALTAEPPKEYAGWNCNQGALRIDIYATSQASCARLLASAVDDLAGIVGPGTVVANLEGPVAIGPWKPNRFLTDPSGYHAVIAYQASGSTASVGLSE